MIDFARAPRPIWEQICDELIDDGYDVSHRNIEHMGRTYFLAKASRPEGPRCEIRAKTLSLAMMDLRDLVRLAEREAN